MFYRITVSSTPNNILSSFGQILLRTEQFWSEFDQFWPVLISSDQNWWGTEKYCWSSTTINQQFCDLQYSSQYLFLTLPVFQRFVWLSMHKYSAVLHQSLALTYLLPQQLVPLNSPWLSNPNAPSITLIGPELLLSVTAHTVTTATQTHLELQENHLKFLWAHQQPLLPSKLVCSHLFFQPSAVRGHSMLLKDSHYQTRRATEEQLLREW